MAGRPPDVEDSELLTILRETEDPVLFTGEVADELSIGRDGVRQRLNELHGKGLVCNKQRGNVIVWWISDEGEEFLADKES